MTVNASSKKLEIRNVLWNDLQNVKIKMILNER